VGDLKKLDGRVSPTALNSESCEMRFTVTAVAAEVIPSIKSPKTTALQRLEGFARGLANAPAISVRQGFAVEKRHNVVFLNVPH
jgi:hypothetical protein